MQNFKFSVADSLPIQRIEKKEEMFLFDLKTVSFWGSKKARSIADSVPRGNTGDEGRPLRADL